MRGTYYSQKRKSVRISQQPRKRRMAAVSSTPLLDLSFLTKEEREKIESVLRADQELQTRDRVYLGTLRQKVEQDRTHQKASVKDEQCTICEKPLYICDHGAPCPNCTYQVCKDCRFVNPNPPQSFVCNVCNKQRLLDLQSVDYMPQLLYSTEPPPLYGTQLLIKSLMTHEREVSRCALKVSPQDFLSDSDHLSDSDLISDSDEEVKRIMKRSDSSDNYSESAEKGNYEISGRVLLGVWFKDDQLFVRVNKASGLAAAKRGVTSDPYVKTYLLLDRHKQSKRKTGIQRKTTNPVYNETFRYEVTRSVLLMHTLWLSVWDWNVFGRNRFLGEVRLPLASMDLTDSTDMWYNLEDKVTLDCCSHGSPSSGVYTVLQPEPDVSEPTVPPWGSGMGGSGNMVEDGRCLVDETPSTSDTLMVPVIVFTEASDEEEVEEEREMKRGSCDIRTAEQSPVHETPPTSPASILPDITFTETSQKSEKDKEEKEEKEEVEREENKEEEREEEEEELVCLRLIASCCDAASDYLEKPPSSLANSSERLNCHSDETMSVHQETPPPYAPQPTVFTSVLPMVAKDQSSELRPLSVTESEPAPAVVRMPLQESAAQPSPSSHRAEEREDSTGPCHSELTSSASSLASFDSMASVDRKTKGDYEITGEVLVGVQYKDRQLDVHIYRARGLAAADSNGFSNPYVKTYLLPDRSKHSKRKTSIKKNTLDPVYNEILKYQVSSTDIANCTLWLSVWDWDQFSRNQFLGEVRLPLASMNLEDGTDRWYNLQDVEVVEVEVKYQGQVKVGLMFTPVTKSKDKTVGTLSIMIKQARDLPQMDSKGGLTDSFVKCHLLPDRSSRGKRKTAVVKNNLNPVWEEQFTYEKVVLEELTTERVLEITAWNFNKGSSNDFIGGLHIGPLPPQTGKCKEWMDSIGDEVSHWETMLTCPGRWMEQWHTFRTTMDPRSVYTARVVTTVLV